MTETASVPRVTIAVVCYNHEKYVAECLESVFAQTYSNIEVVILDDASSDGSVEVIRKWLETNGLTAEVIEHETNTGLCRGLNELRRGLSGDYVCFFSADDVMMPNRVATQVADLESHGPDWVVSFSDGRVIDGSGTHLRTIYQSRPPAPRGDVYRELLKRNRIMAPTVMIRVEALEKAGTYDESLLSEDYDMWLRLARIGRFSFVDEQLVTYRVLDSSLDHVLQADALRYGRDMTRVLAKHMDGPSDIAAIAAIPLGGIAKNWYLAGGSAAEVSPYLRLAARHDGRLLTRAYLLAARLHVPGRTLRAPRDAWSNARDGWDTLRRSITRGPKIDRNVS